jgi:hypothetical protein
MQKCRPPQEPRLFFPEYEDAVGERGDGVAVCLPDPRCRQAIGMQLSVDLISGGQVCGETLMGSGPAMTEMLILKVAALGAGPVSGRQCGCLVKEEELGIRSRLHDGAVPATELEAADQPSPALAIPDDPLLRIVEHASIAEHQASLGHRLEVAQGRDTVLSRHCYLLMRVIARASDLDGSDAATRQ